MLIYNNYNTLSLPNMLTLSTISLTIKVQLQDCSRSTREN